MEISPLRDSLPGLNLIPLQTSHPSRLPSLKSQRIYDELGVMIALRGFVVDSSVGYGVFVSVEVGNILAGFNKFVIVEIGISEFGLTYVGNNPIKATIIVAIAGIRTNKSGLTAFGLFVFLLNSSSFHYFDIIPMRDSLYKVSAGETSRSIALFTHSLSCSILWWANKTVRLCVLSTTTTPRRKSGACWFYLLVPFWKLQVAFQETSPGAQNEN